MHIYKKQTRENGPADFTPRLDEWALAIQQRGRRFSEETFEIYKDAELVGTCTLNSRGNEPDEVEIIWPDNEVDYLNLRYEPADGRSAVDLLSEKQKEKYYRRIVESVIDNPELANQAFAQTISVGSDLS